MIYKCAVVIAFIDLTIGLPYWKEKDERTLEFEPEYDHTMGSKKAAMEHAYLKYQADQDEFGPTRKTKLGDFIYHDYDDYKHYLSEYYDPGFNEPEVQDEDPRFEPFPSDSEEEGQHVQEEYEEPRYYEHDEYEYQYKNPKRGRRSVERYEGPSAPLKEDLTVDFTPEFKQATNAHLAAIEKEYRRLHEAAALAAAHPDRTSPPSKSYNNQHIGQEDIFVPEQHQHRL